MPPSEMTATSVVPPPMSTTMFPVGSATGRPAPMAAAIGSSMRKALRAPPTGWPPRPRASRPRDARRHAHHHARVRPAVLVHLLDEVPQHLLGHVEVGDDAVLERPDCADVPGRPPEHPRPRCRPRAPRRCADRSRPRRARKPRSPARGRTPACWPSGSTTMSRRRTRSGSSRTRSVASRKCRLGPRPCKRRILPKAPSVGQADGPALEVAATVPSGADDRHPAVPCLAVVSD